VLVGVCASVLGESASRPVPSLEGDDDALSRAVWGASLGVLRLSVLKTDDILVAAIGETRSSSSYAKRLGLLFCCANAEVKGLLA
jgi:hypothetical protein